MRNAGPPGTVGSVQYSCFVGTFPELHRAWITFDNRLFIWKLDDP